jgi:hypothetical protein
VLTEKLREHLAFTLAGLTLAGLGTLGSLSFGYILTYNDMAKIQYRKDEQAFNEFFAKIPRALAFQNLELETDKRSLARTDKFLKALGRKNDKGAGSSLRDIYESSLKEAMLDLAGVSGYSPETTGLSSRFHDTVQAPLRAEVEYWHYIGKNLSALESGRLSPAGKADLQARLLDMEFASRALTSAAKDVDFDRDLRTKAFEQQRDDRKVERERGERWFNWAFAGLFVAILGFYFIFGVTISFFGSGPTPVPAPAADAAAKN